MTTQDLYPAPSALQESAWINKEQYKALYLRSLKDPESFWDEQGQSLQWMEPYSKVKNTSFDRQDFRIRWYEDGTLNACVNCLDRHLEERGNKIALIWEGDSPTENRTYTYQELYREVCQFATVLKTQGLKKGDRVTIYLPMIPEAVIAMLACARIGAIHAVVFGGFSAESLMGRILDCGSSFVITADNGLRGGKIIPLKQTVDEALRHPEITTVKHVIVVRRTGNPVPFTKGRDLWYHELMAKALPSCHPEEMNAEDPLFILYTSGSTGKPKGVLHTTAGYLVFASLTHRTIFDYHEEDVYWCTADVGWITGHTYGVYGPLANGATILLFEGIPSFPDASRFWQVIDKHQVTIFYTAPTAIRALMSEGNEPVLTTNRRSLRILGTVGEPINPEAWLWYHDIVGEGRCPIVDTWWQTETGGILITPLPGATDLKPGSATLPFFGIQPALVNEEGQILEGAAEGSLVFLDSWPGQMRTVFGDHERFLDTYFTTFKGVYNTGDGARRDDDGYYWITGRMDDIIKVSGHRLGTAEIESAINSHPQVAESAVVGFPHSIKGQGIYAFVMLIKGAVSSEKLQQDLVDVVRSHIGPIAKIDIIQWAPNLPRTRSGKIMRRLLRKIAAQDFDTLGDTSTLTDPDVVKNLITDRLRQD